MRTRLRHLWEVLTTGYWFVPMLMTVSAAIAAFVLVYVDRRVIGADDHLAWLYAGGADGAKTLLSTVAGSVITVAGVVFSITIASLTQASSQFGPRLLRNFMRDSSNQLVLGTFVATFLYCLLVLRTIHGEVLDGKPFVPQASVTVAVLLAVASLAVLIYFIHHVSTSLQAPAVVAAVRADLDRAIARFPEIHGEAALAGNAAEGDELRAQLAAAGRCVASTSEGYIQAIDFDGLVGAATEHGLRILLEHRPGDYMIRGTPLLRMLPAQPCSDDLECRLNAAFICGVQGTPEQDIEYAIRQMVEVAVRALSPGINDPFTAVNCIDALGAALCSIARRGLPGPCHRDGGGVLRIVAPVSTFDGIAGAAFNQIRQYGAGSVAVALRLLEVITVCAGQMRTADQRQSLLRHAEMVHRQSESAVPEGRDRADLRDRWEAAARALGGTAAGGPGTCVPQPTGRGMQSA